MKAVKVVEIADESIKFDNGMWLSSDHERDCCENHYLSFSDLSEDDFEGLEFDLTTDSFFDRIEGYGIQLNPIHGHPVRVAGYGNNNGYYSANLSLVLIKGSKLVETFDITECQDIDWQ